MTENNDSKKHFDQPFNLNAHVPPPPPARPSSAAPSAMPSLSDIKKPELRNVDMAKTMPPRAVPAPPSRPITDNTPIRPTQVSPTQSAALPFGQPVRPLASVPEVNMQIKPAPLNVPKNPMVQPTQIAPSQHEIPKKIEQNPLIMPTVTPIREAVSQVMHQVVDANRSDNVQLPLIEQPIVQPIKRVVDQEVESFSQPQSEQSTPKSLHVPVLQANTFASEHNPLPAGQIPPVSIVAPVAMAQQAPIVPSAPPRPAAVAAPPPAPARPEMVDYTALSQKVQSAASSMADSFRDKPVTMSQLPPAPAPAIKVAAPALPQSSDAILHEQAQRALKSMSTLAPPPPPPLPQSSQRISATEPRIAADAKQLVQKISSEKISSDLLNGTTALRSKVAQADVQDKAKDLLDDAKEKALSKSKGLFSSFLKKDKPSREADSAPHAESSLKSSLLASLESEATKKQKPSQVVNIVNQQQAVVKEMPAAVQQQPVAPITAPVQTAFVAEAEIHHEQDDDAQMQHQEMHDEQAYHEEVQHQETPQHTDPAPLSNEEREAMARASLPPLPAVPRKLPKRGQSQLQDAPAAPAAYAYEGHTSQHHDGHEDYESDGVHQAGFYDQFKQPVQHYQPVEGAILPHLLTEILRQHKIWLDSEGREGKRANLYGEDLRYADLRGADLRSVNMRGALLDNLDVSGANFEDADLAEASLRFIHAPKGLFQRANFTGADCEGAVLDGADLSYTEALSCNFANAHLQGAFMQGANLRDANLAQANMSYASLTGACCRGVNISHTLFNHADLMNVELREAYCLQTQFVSTNLAGASFKDAHFEEMSFAESDFTKSHDVPIHYQNAGVQQEKVSLQEEKEALKKLESELKKKQAEVTQMKLKMQEQHNMVSSLVADEQRYVTALLTLSKRMKIVSIIWFAILAITIIATLVTVASIPMDELNMFELSILVTVPLLIFILCLFSAGLVNSARNKINTHAKVRDHKIVDLDKNQ